MTKWVQSWLVFFIQLCMSFKKLCLPFLNPSLIIIQMLYVRLLIAISIALPLIQIDYH